MKSTLKVSIITAVFNSNKTIEHCINSVLNQSYKALEHIIIDGGSTDGTVEIVKKYGDRIAKFISEPDNGMYDALNKGIRLATSEIIGFLHADDLYSSNEVIEKVTYQMEKYDVDSCYGDLLYVDRKDPSRIIRYWKSGDYNPRKFYWGWMPPHPTFFVRRWVYDKYGYFNLELGSAADYELMLRFLLKYGITTKYIPEVLIKMRVGGISNATVKNRIAANRMDRKAWEVNDLNPYPWTVLLKPLRKLPQWFMRPRTV